MIPSEGGTGGYRKKGGVDSRTERQALGEERESQGREAAVALRTRSSRQLNDSRGLAVRRDLYDQVERAGDCFPLNPGVRSYL